MMRASIRYFDFHVRRFGILRGHEATNVAQAIEGRERLALDTGEQILIAFFADLWVVDLAAGAL